MPTFGAAILAGTEVITAFEAENTNATPARSATSYDRNQNKAFCGYSQNCNRNDQNKHPIDRLRMPSAYPKSYNGNFA